MILNESRLRSKELVERYNGHSLKHKLVIYQLYSLGE